MKEIIINIEKLTKDYGHGRGVFDVSLHVQKGECFGFLGPNGAGKTTTIRHLMGFSKPQNGICTILGTDCWTSAAELKTRIGYLPGEIAFPSAITGRQFLHMMMNMRDVKDHGYCKQLLERFELNPDIDIDEMSLGMKRKLAVVTAFLHNPDILILDEPTSGLDPIMQQTFIDYIREEKERGKTIFLSSHMFHEVDAVCDRIAVIKEGRIASVFISEELKQKQDSIYQITFENREDFDRFCVLPFRYTANENALSLRIMVNASELNDFIKAASETEFLVFKEIPFTLEDYFMGFYKKEKSCEEVSV